MRAVNLIPAEQRSGAAGRRRALAGRRLRGAVLLGGLALMAFLYGRADHQIASRRAQAATLTAQAQQAQADGRTARALHELHRACANSAHRRSTR